jgi:arabinofuranosyltransferase
MRNRIAYLILALFGAIIALILWSSRLSYPIDDTFITFRYAENLANGYGLVWNPAGPPTEGYTNFLYVLLLAPFAGAGTDLLLVAQLLNVLAVIVSSFFIFKLALISGEKAHWIALLAPSLFLLTAATWANAFSGMETSVFGALLLAGFSYVWHPETRSRTFGYALIFLASLTRPEGATLGVIVGIIQLWRDPRRKTLVSMMLGLILPLALYYVGKRLYFGYWLPNSFAVKVTQSIGDAQGLFHGLQAVKLFVLRVWPLLLLAFVPLIFTRNRRCIAALTWALLVIAAYSVPVPLMGFFDRFFYSSEVFLYALAGAAALLLFRELGSGQSMAALGVIVALLIFSNTQSPRAKEILSWDLSEINDRLAVISMDLRNLPNAKTITFATSDAGMMPYYSRMNHFDLAGLNDNEIAHSTTADQVIERIMLERPEVLLLGADWSASGADDTCRRISRAVHGKLSTAVDRLLIDPRFQQYQPTAAYLTGVYDYAVLLDTQSPKFSALDSAYKQRINANMFFVKRLTCIN